MTISFIKALWLHLDFSVEEKMEVLIGFVQVGIDLFAIAQNGYIDSEGNMAQWVNNGGHGAGRKWPILFAGIMLGDSNMIGMPEWGIVHGTNWFRDTALWETAYRECCTAVNWSGFMLSALIMDAVDEWDHDVIFDYLDRYIQYQNTYNDGSWDFSRGVDRRCMGNPPVCLWLSLGSERLVGFQCPCQRPMSHVVEK